ncbi:MAG: hypothetical protein EOO02_08485 [Chitinophagaceae bacterium]|nr:MAG: hypothetical protein EOO02_08485 [Chitinophagaceae bacterium]
MKSFFKTAAFVLVLFITGNLSAQSFDSILTKLDAQYPQEKLHLHFDRSAYSPGETIWFKAYLFANNALSGISKNLYAELIDEQGKILQRKITPFVTGGAAAAFDLPTELSANAVYVRAYTGWMLNFDTSFLFVKAIPILNSKDAPKQAPPAVINYLTFFPEGGDLVQGIESRVAFKATNGSGLPFNVKGDIVDSKGAKVAAFASEHDGMGSFILIPSANETYKASWKDQAGKAQTTTLPAAKKSGVVLETRKLPQGITFGVKAPQATAQQLKSVYIVAQMQQQLLYRAKASLEKNPVVSGMIPIQNVPAGIVQITVFSEDEKPLAERIVFVNTPDYYFITDLNTPLKSTAKRGRNVIQIDVPDSIVCNMSVAITDASANPVEPGEQDIFSRVLLTSDIKGYVHNPMYYFSSEQDSVLHHLDLVMMTNGWRRFRWEDVLAGKYPTITEKPDDYLLLKGKVNGLTKSELTGKELTGIVTSESGGQQLLNIPVNTDGSFQIPDMFFYDTVKLYYQFNNDKNKVLSSKALIDIRNSFIPKISTFRPGVELASRMLKADQGMLSQNKLLNDRMITQIEDNRKVQTLASVEVRAKQKTPKQKMDEEYTSGLFRGEGNSYTFIADGDPFAAGALTVLNYLQGKVAGLQITGQGAQMSMSWRGSTPSLFLNEMNSDLSMVQGISMNDVAMVKVFRPPFMGGFGGSPGGAIAVYTKKGKAATDNIKGLDFASIPGYTPPKQFYSPDYSKIEPEHSDGDFRTTLYWNPFVLTDANNRRILFTFYNNDVSKKLRVVLEGVNLEGKLTRMERIIE